LWSFRRQPPSRRTGRTNNGVQSANASGIILRPPSTADGNRAYHLVRRCPPLDLNSPYSYLLLCTHFRATCTLAEKDGELFGFQSGYRKPDDPDTLFIWQICVATRARGQGIGALLVRDVLERNEYAPPRFLELSVTGSNRASRALFASLARHYSAELSEHPLFEAGSFPAPDHEAEYLLRIGPIDIGSSGTETPAVGSVAGHTNLGGTP
jgi:L-2,4-diaminobutyric acid acetyltransferase